MSANPCSLHYAKCRVFHTVQGVRPQRVAHPRLYCLPQVSHLTRVFGAITPPASFPFIDRFDLNDVPPHFGQANPPCVRSPALLIFFAISLLSRTKDY